MGRSDDGDGEAKMEDGLYPLRKVPMANAEQGPIGDVSVPLNTGDVREFKKEMGRLLEDPIGVAERLDQFLGPNIYTWVELQSILGILFTMEEREMIRHSGMRVWDRECQAPDQGDQKWPMQDPGWNNQNERHRQNMSDLRWMIIRGIWEAVPKGQNIRKALSEHQGKDEPLADWLERLRKALQLYSGVDPDTAAGQDREGTIYNGSKYAFGVVHTFRKIWKERGFINTQRKGLVHQGLIIQILKALKSPKKIAVVHVKGHQRRRGIKTRRNNLADDEAKKAALRENSNVIMTFQEAGTQNQTPYFYLTEVEAMKNLGGTLKEGQWILPDEATIRNAEKG
ncbi:hypothetical protein DUI87_24353 [Hirundo rustica rustica]|uniref:RNase H type-1 domain-containing protein n=1 Tax=Hirundo rustica rustica TaxID=333673 RepID=A0A3M0JJF0_HIRRU|nr:hypothetical protein DUI87_24353 [Hirundo rustica rustica]